MGSDFQKSLIATAIFLTFIFHPYFCYNATAEDDGWDAVRPKPRWTEKQTVRGGASHLVSRKTAKEDRRTPSDTEVFAISTPGVVFEWAPLWHNDGLGGCRIIAHGVFSDLSGCWFAERTGKVPGPYSTLFICGNNYTGEIAGGRLLEDRLISCAAWNNENLGWFAAVIPQDKYSRQEILFIPAKDDLPIRSIAYSGSQVQAVATLADGSLWIADTDGRLWHSVDIFRGWALEIVGTYSGADIHLAAAASGRHMMIAAGNDFFVFDKNGKEYSHTPLPCQEVKYIASASANSAVLLDGNDNVLIYSDGSIRKLDDFARAAVWLPQSNSYLIALRQKDYLQMTDQEGDFLEARAKSKPGVPEFLLPMPSGEALLFTATGKFSRISPTGRSLKFTPVFGSEK